MIEYDEREGNCYGWVIGNDRIGVMIIWEGRVRRASGLSESMGPCCCQSKLFAHPLCTLI